MKKRATILLALGLWCGVTAYIAIAPGMIMFSFVVIVNLVIANVVENYLLSIQQ